MALATCFVASIILEGLRLCTPRLFPFKKIFKALSRPGEAVRPAGYLYFFLGALLVVGLLEKDIAIISLTASIIGDVVSALIGTWLGKARLPRRGRTVEGTLAGVLAIAALSIIYPPCLMMVAATSFIIVEVLGPSILDDNLLHPLAMGVAMQLYDLLV